MRREEREKREKREDRRERAESPLEYPSVKITPSEHNAKDIDLACLYSLDTFMNGAQKRTD